MGPSAASDASCLATSTGWRPGSTATDVPTFRRVVRPSAYAMPANGSTAGLYTSSENHSESTPAASSRSITAGSRSTAVSMPRLTPNRIFTVHLASSGICLRLRRIRPGCHANAL